MPPSVKNESNYTQVSFEAGRIKAAIRGVASGRKQPTSVALDPKLIAELEAAAKGRGVPYQVLMRMFIMEGFERFRHAS